MFAMSYVELLVVGTLLLVGLTLWRTVGGSRWVRVDDHHPVDVAADALEAPLTRLLGELPGTELTAQGPGTWTLVVRRARWWTVPPAALLFPLGLLLLVLFREQGDLVVTVRPAPDGAVVRGVGTTRLSVARALADAVTGLPAGGGRQPTGTPPR